MKQRQTTLNDIPTVSFSFKERSVDVPLIEEGDLLDHLFRLLKDVGLTSLDSFLLLMLIMSLIGLYLSYFLSREWYHHGWVTSGLDKLLTNHQERIEHLDFLKKWGKHFSKDSPEVTLERKPTDHPTKHYKSQVYVLLFKTNIPFFIVGVVFSLMGLVVMFTSGLREVIIEHASLSQAVVEQEQQLIGLRSALESLYSEEVIRSAKHADLLKSLFEVNKEVALLQKHIYYLQGTLDLSILKNAEELARLQETVDSLLTYQEEQKLRSLLTSLEKRLCTTLQVIGTDSQ